MAPRDSRSRAENHEYIDQHGQHPYEMDFDMEPPADNPFWFPDNPPSTATAWRYMDLAKFISILQTNSLWFSHHSNFEDPYDGRYSEVTVDQIRSDYDELGLDTPDSIDEDSTLDYDNYVSCWNIKEEQSVALWDMYFDGEVGVVIKTTVNALVNSVASEDDLSHSFNFMSGKVEYCSVENEPRGYYGPIFSKRPIFDFENEYRMVFTASRSQSEDTLEDRSTSSSKGIPVPVDVEALVDEVYVSPKAGGYVRSVIENLADDYELDIDIRQSSLFTHPHDSDE
jgi:hypothetical protein